MTETFTERATRLKAEIHQRELERQAGTRPKRTWRDRVVGLSATAALALILLLGLTIGLTVIGLIVFAIVLSAGPLLTTLGSIAVIAVASTAWQQAKKG